MFTIEERAKLLHDIITAQKRFLTQQRAVEIRSRPPTRTQLRNQMMTYLKHVGGKKHFDLKTKNFEEIQVLYEKKDESIKKESKEEESTRKKKLSTRKKMKSRKLRFRQDTFEDDEKENDELRLCLTIALDEDKEVDYVVLDKKYPIIEWKTYNGQRRYFSTLMRLLSIFDREDLNVVYKLVMDRYHDEVPEGLVIHMLVEKQYPLRKKVLVQMLELKLESEEDNTMALELIRFVKKLIVELEPENSDGNEKDL
ncbi:hypothetical protein Tco_1319604 [Tanacetum coccineum]